MEAFVVGYMSSGLVSSRLAMRILGASLAHACASPGIWSALSYMRYTGLDNSWSDGCADTHSSNWHVDTSRILNRTVSHAHTVVFLCKEVQMLVSSVSKSTVYTRRYGSTITVQAHVGREM